MRLGRRIIILLLVSVASIGCDQGTKIWADEHLLKNETKSYLSDTIRIGYTENTGAFLGFGSDLPSNVRFGLFVVCVGLILAGVMFHVLLGARHIQTSISGFALVFSGGRVIFTIAWLMTEQWSIL